MRQDALAAELGVSKIPLREALARLEQEGLLRSETNRGYFVRAAERGRGRARSMRCASSSSPKRRRSPRPAQASEDRQAAADALEALDRATRDHGATVGALNRAFHLALVRPAASR